MRYALIAEHRPLFSVRAMCRCLRIHPSGFYAWLKKPLSKRAEVWKLSNERDVIFVESGSVVLINKPISQSC